ncbi:MAG: OmpA/MotB family protein [Pseudomonadales bacterium]
MNKAIKLHEEDNDNGWIVTFADLVTLLLVFFILLFSISTLEKETFVKTIDAVKTALQGTGAGTQALIDVEKVETGTVPTDSNDPSTETGEKEQAPTEIEQPIITTPFAITPPEPSSKAKKDEKAQQELAKLSKSLNQLIKTSGNEDDAKISPPIDGKIVINIRGSLFFNAGSAQFRRQAMPIMDGIGNILRKNTKFNLAIGGHTDNIPISTNRFPSNWELSAIRATSVLRYFIRGGMAPERLTATGYGESQPLGPNETPEERDTNRRIEFVLERN